MKEQESWLKQKMSPSGQLAWIKQRRSSLDALHQANQVGREKAYVKHMENLQEDPYEASPIHEIFSASDEVFDPEFAARLITDNDLELMSDLQERAGTSLIYAHLRLFLEVEGKSVKQYPVEYGTFFSEFRLKKLMEQVSPGHFVLNERGKRVYLLAKELAKKEIEQWESWRDMPNLYRMNNLQETTQEN